MPKREVNGKPKINPEAWNNARKRPSSPATVMAEAMAMANADARTLLITEDGDVGVNKGFKKRHLFQPGVCSNPHGQKGKDGQGGKGIKWLRHFSRSFLQSEDGQVLLLVRSYKDPQILKEMLHYAFGKPVDITEMPDDDEDGGKDITVRFIRPGSNIPKGLEVE